MRFTVYFVLFRGFFTATGKITRSLIAILSDCWYCSLHIFYGTDKKNLFDSHKLVKLVIISFILTTLMFDSGVIL